MDKVDIILEKLEALERIESEIKALKNNNKDIHNRLNKLDTLEHRVEMTWQAVQEIQNELTDNSLKIKIIDNKVKAL